MLFFFYFITRKILGEGYRSGGNRSPDLFGNCEESVELWRECWISYFQQERGIPLLGDEELISEKKARLNKVN
jgi:hypothetical protein